MEKNRTQTSSKMIANWKGANLNITEMTVAMVMVTELLNIVVVALNIKIV